MVMIKDQYGRKMKLIRPKPGERIKLIRQDGNNGQQKVHKAYTVVKLYESYILCVTDSGIRECITNGELVQHGLCKNG